MTPTEKTILWLMLGMIYGAVTDWPEKFIDFIVRAFA